MPGEREPLLFSEITVTNLLSFGPQGVTLPMRALNVLVGPNGSGKTNLVEVFELLKATPVNVAAAVSPIGVRELCFKDPTNSDLKSGSIRATSCAPRGSEPIAHALVFVAGEPNTPWVVDQVFTADHEAAVVDFDLKTFEPVVRRGDQTWRPGKGEYDGQQSLLSQFRGPQYPEMTALSRRYGSIAIYRQIPFGPDSVLRRPCAVAVRNEQLASDFSNFAGYLAQLRIDPGVSAGLRACLRDFSDAFDDVEVRTEAGQYRVWVTEKSGISTPSQRLSDGTLRFLALAALLLDPKPAPLTVIEEPETGLHPDLIPLVGKLLVEASSRGQFVVTTHSDMLVSSLSEVPESIVVCEKHEGSTQMRRLAAAEVAPYLETYRLGDLWLKGQFGGVRW